MNFLIAFLTGLTSGGLSCLAVQSGLLTSTLAHQVEQDFAAHGNIAEKFKPHIAQPIFLFLLAKLTAYTIFGAILGAIGSFIQFTPTMSAILYLAIGVFMLGNGLRMLNIHPVFRYFVFEPPSFLTRFIRHRSKVGASLITPLFMGALTVFLPCGITQAMLAAALGTSSAIMGAGLMFAFILGTSPLFFSVSYFATRLGATIEKYFTRIVALTMMLLALVSINSGLNLLGSPYSLNSVLSSLSTTLYIPDGLSQRSFNVEVSDNGYNPVVLHLPANKQLTIEWVSDHTQSCALSVVIPGLNYQKLLPPTGRVKMDISPQKKGTVIRYSCSMGMYLGQMVFDLDS